MNNNGKHSLDVAELRAAVALILQKPSDPNKPRTIEDEIGIKPEQLVIPCKSVEGKLGGRLIFDLGGISEIESQKLREEAKKLGRSSRAFVFYQDQVKVRAKVNHPKKVTHEMLFGKKQQNHKPNVENSKAVRELERRKISKKGHGQNLR